MENDWDDGYIIEGSDRLHIAMQAISEHISEHPAIVKAGCREEIDTALGYLIAAYQKVGALDDCKG